MHYRKFIIRLFLTKHCNHPFWYHRSNTSFLDIGILPLLKTEKIINLNDTTRERLTIQYVSGLCDFDNLRGHILRVHAHRPLVHILNQNNHDQLHQYEYINQDRMFIWEKLSFKSVKLSCLIRIKSRKFEELIIAFRSFRFQL